MIPKQTEYRDAKTEALLNLVCEGVEVPSDEETDSLDNLYSEDLEEED